MKRGTLLLAVGLVVVVAVPGTAAATPSPETVEVACENTPEQTTVLWVAGDNTTITDDVTLYPGTQVYVGYCGNDGPSPPETDGWSIDAGVGFSTVSGSDLYSGTVSESRGTIVLDEETIVDKAPDNTVTVTVQQGPRVQSNLTDSTLLFPNDTAAVYRDRERAYRSSATELTAAAERLSESADTLESATGVPVAELQAANQTLANVSDTRRATAASAEAVRTLLYDNVTGVEQAPGSYARAMEALDEHERETNETVMNATRQYDSALDTVAGTARRTILTNLLIGLVPGLLVGSVGGAAVIRRLGESAQYFRDYGAGDYGTKELYILVGVGLGLVALGVAALLITGTLGAIL